MSESKELTIPERAAIALGSVENKVKLRELVAQSSTIAEIKNKAAREQCHAAAMALRTRRTDIRKVGKDARDEATKFSKAVISEEDALVAIIEPEEQRLITLRDAWDEAEAAEKAAKAAAEKARVDAIRKRIAETQAIPSTLVGKSSETIAAAIESLEAVEITLETHQEFAGEAEVAKLAAVTKLGEMLTAQLAHEAEQARIAAEREAIEQQRAELAERERIADEQAAEAARIQAEKDAAVAEQKRRERVQFELNGPGESEIIRVLAEQFKVTPEVALGWIATFDMAYADQMEKAA
ncbi:hypothetical protein SAMN05443245_5189 [Paraburkholderia fungorum]|uniref:Uncharacterized protein n=1 Tax=Paraburkholderia fungorum TaxID=134537 RepID=A0A1H1IHP1_9BURK|nr:hypothetical protein [Paraburkholderia fungorum]SDR37144.1 hypothetical protein SAMN05443245_5189 [Paraburkholderia fungorum]